MKRIMQVEELQKSYGARARARIGVSEEFREKREIVDKEKRMYREKNIFHID